MKNHSLQEFVKLRRKLAEEKASIEKRLRQISQALGEIPATAATPAAPSAAAKGARRKRGLSEEGRARIAAAQRARWAAARGEADASSPSPAEAGASGRGPRTMSAAARQAISEAARRRWAARKAQGKNNL